MLGVSPVRGVATDGGTTTDGTDHEVQGVGLDTVVRCSKTGQSYGPGSNGPTQPTYCPYCGDSATDGPHRIARAYDEVFCDHTGMSSWRYCPGCGDESIETSGDRQARTDGGFVRTSDADLAAHDHASSLEAALDHVLEAGGRARDGRVDDAAVARLQLATCGTRLAFYAMSAEERTVGVHDATEHLETVVEAVEDETVAEPVRRALQLLAASEGGDAA